MPGTIVRALLAVGESTDETMSLVNSLTVAPPRWRTINHDVIPRVQLPERFDLAVFSPGFFNVLPAHEHRLAIHNVVTHLQPSAQVIAFLPLGKSGYLEHAQSCGLKLIDDRTVTAAVVHRRTARTTIHDLVAEARLGLQRLTPAVLANRLTAGRAIVLDTRTPTDRSRFGVIPGSIHAPRTTLEWMCDPTSGYSHERIVGFDQMLVTVCNEGYSSSLAAASLQRSDNKEYFMTPISTNSFGRRALIGGAFIALALAACGSSGGDGASGASQAATETTAPAATVEPTGTEPVAPTQAPLPTGAPAATEVATKDGGKLRISAIPDQDPEKLNRLYGLVSTYLGEELGVEVEYVPVTDYASAVSLFRAGDLDLVWFGGLTGVQARLQTPGSVIIAQRNIDEAFHSVFIANVGAGLAPVTDVAGLSVFGGKSFTFGSESSTSGRLMPQYFLDQAGIGPDGFDGEAGFSGSHDKTIDLVAAGTYQAGALNEQVWRKRISAGTVDTTQVVELFITPGYHDYHWMLSPDAVSRYGDGFADQVQAALTGLSPGNADDLAILDLFGAKGFVPSEAANYTEIEAIGRKLGLITD
jgi:phosphonate transport system substrate-binding protein